jgi:hemin uptake protein HemP
MECRPSGEVEKSRGARTDMGQDERPVTSETLFPGAQQDAQPCTVEKLQL